MTSSAYLPCPLPLLCVCRPLWSLLCSVGGQLVAGEEVQGRGGGGGVLGLALGVAQPSWQLTLPLLLLLLLLIGIWYYKSIVIIQIIFSIFPWACRTCLYVYVCASPTSPASCWLNTYQSFRFSVYRFVCFAFKLFMALVNMQHWSTLLYLLYLWHLVPYRAWKLINLMHFYSTYISHSWSPNWRNTTAKFSPGARAANFRARLIVVNVAWFAYEMNNSNSLSSCQLGVARCAELLLANENSWSGMECCGIFGYCGYKYDERFSLRVNNLNESKPLIIWMQYLRKY